MTIKKGRHDAPFVTLTLRIEVKGKGLVVTKDACHCEAHPLFCHCEAQRAEAIPRSNPKLKALNSKQILISKFKTFILQKSSPLMGED